MSDFSSSDYWEKRYVSGRDSGAGSYGRLAKYKADILNKFVENNDVKSVIEFGSGDGAQLKLAKYPRYLGLDVSKESISMCLKIFKKDKNKSFMYFSSDHYDDTARFVTADLTMSLDVIYHLVEDEVFNKYMSDLFNASNKYVIVYASNKKDKGTAQHVKHREFTKWVKKNRKDFKLVEKLDNPYPFNGEDPQNTSFADFYIFRKN